jgi:hypothetical protein
MFPSMQFPDRQFHDHQWPLSDPPAGPTFRRWVQFISYHLLPWAMVACGIG